MLGESWWVFFDLIGKYREGSHDANGCESAQGTESSQSITDMPAAHGTMVRRTVLIPTRHEFTCAAGESIPTVGIADFHDRPGDRFRFGIKKCELALLGFDHR